MHSLNRVATLAVVGSLAAASAAGSPLSAQAANPARAIPVARPSSAMLALAPFQAGDFYFNADSAGTLYVRDGLNGRMRVLLPAGSYSAVAPSHDGKYLAYALPSNAEGASEVHIRTVQTGRDLPDVLHRATMSSTPWTHNQKGFFYVRHDATENRERVYYHSLGRAESRDAVMLSEADHPEWGYDARVSDDGHYAVFTISHPVDAHTRLYFIDLDDPGKPKLDAPKVRLVDNFGSRYAFVDNAGSYFFLQTDREAPRGRVVLANTDLTRETSWPVVIPESPDSLLYARTAGDEYIIPVYRSAGATVARIYSPPDPAVMREEFRKRLDSLRKERETRRGHRPDSDTLVALRMRNPAPIRLDLKGDFPLPAGASIVAMNTVADRDQIFYTVRTHDGKLGSFMYNVKKASGSPFPAGGR